MSRKHKTNKYRNNRQREREKVGETRKKHPRAIHKVHNDREAVYAEYTTR